jgi:hypothetical protein
MQPPDRQTFFVGNCRDCGYPLARLQSHRCPECGRPFDPENPRTMDFGRSRLITFLSRPTSVWTWTPAAVVCGIALCAHLQFPAHPGSIALIGAAVLTAGATWYISAARSRFRRFLKKRDRVPPAPPRMHL